MGKLTLINISFPSSIEHLVLSADLLDKGTVPSADLFKKGTASYEWHS